MANVLCDQELSKQLSEAMEKAQLAASNEEELDQLRRDVRLLV